MSKILFPYEQADDHRESGIGWKSLLQCALFGVHWAKNIGGECYVCESTIGEDH